MAEEASKQLLADARKLLRASDFSDLEIRCGDQTFQVHKVIMCTRSRFFANAIKFPGKEHTESLIDLPDDDPEIIRLLISYIYEAEYEPHLPLDIFKFSRTDTRPEHSCTSNQMGCRNYYASRIVCQHHTCGLTCAFTCKGFVCDTCHPPPVIVPGPSSQLLTHAKMYEVGDKYHVSGLKEMAKFKFELSCAKFWGDELFAEAAAYAFSTTPEDDQGLRRIVCRTISEHMGLLKKESIGQLLNECSRLACELLMEKAEKCGWLK